MENVVVVELAALPEPLLHDGLVDVPVLVGDELALARVVVVHAQVRADEELPLEQLHADDSEHEDEEHGDGHDVADGLDGDDHALDHLLEAGRPVDGAERTQHPQHTENLQEADARPSEDGDQRHGHHHHIQNVERCTTESAGVEKKAIGYQLEGALYGEHRREEIVEFPQNHIDGRGGLERVLAGEEGGGHEDADQDQVGADGVSLHLPAEHADRVRLAEDEERGAFRDGRSAAVATLAVPLALLHDGLLLLHVHCPGNVFVVDLSSLVLILHKFPVFIRIHREPVTTDHFLLLRTVTAFNGLDTLSLPLDSLGLGLALRLVLVSGQVVHSDGQEDVEEDEVTGDEEDDEVHGGDGPQPLDATVGLDAIVHHHVPILSGQDLQ